MTLYLQVTLCWCVSFSWHTNTTFISQRYLVCWCYLLNMCYVGVLKQRLLADIPLMG